MNINSILITLIVVLIINYPLNSHCSTIHDLLKSQGLPGGLFPRNVECFSLNENGVLEVKFNEPCEAKFDTLVRFDTIVKANLSYGGLNGVQGLSQEELFLWLPVKDIIVQDPSSGVILFDIGVAQKQLAFSLFEDPPICIPHHSSYIQKLGRKEKGIHELQKYR